MATESASERQEEILQALEEDEEELRVAMHELAEATERKLDVTQYIRESPIGWLAGAFCVGLWLGMDSGSPEPPSSLEQRRTR